jgi:hypothetical protein
MGRLRSDDHRRGRRPLTGKGEHIALVEVPQVNGRRIVKNSLDSLSRYRRKKGKNVKIAAVQFTPVFGRIAEIVLGRRTSAAGAADLVVLPEVAFTGYVFKSKDELASFAEPADGETPPS